MLWGLWSCLMWAVFSMSALVGPDWFCLTASPNLVWYVPTLCYPDWFCLTASPNLVWYVPTLCYPDWFCLTASPNWYGMFQPCVTQTGSDSQPKPGMVCSNPVLPRLVLSDSQPKPGMVCSNPVLPRLVLSGSDVYVL